MTTHYRTESVPESSHPIGQHDFLCPAQVSAALDNAVVESSLLVQRHAWDYSTNLDEIVVDHNKGTFNFVLKAASERHAKLRKLAEAMILAQTVTVPDKLLGGRREARITRITASGTVFVTRPGKSDLSFEPGEVEVA